MMQYGAAHTPVFSAMRVFRALQIRDGRLAGHKSKLTCLSLCTRIAHCLDPVPIKRHSQLLSVGLFSE